MRALVLVSLLATQAQAAPVVCEDRSVIEGLLGGQYNEVRKFIGDRFDGGVLELWVSQSGTWSLTETESVDGKLRTCVRAVGNSGQYVPGEAL